MSSSLAVGPARQSGALAGPPARGDLLGACLAGRVAVGDELGANLGLLCFLGVSLGGGSSVTPGRSGRGVGGCRASGRGAVSARAIGSGALGRRTAVDRPAFEQIPFPFGQRLFGAELTVPGRLLLAG